MSEDRKELALIAIRDRVQTVKDELELNAFVRNPTKPVDASMCPAVMMVEGIDEIKKSLARGTDIFPVIREGEVIIEIIVDDTESAFNDYTIDLKGKYRKIRNAVLSDIYPLDVTDRETRIREIRTEGPLGYGIPGLLGMRFVLGLTYTDKG